MAKKPNTKEIAKQELYDVLRQALAETEYEVAEGADYGFKSFSLVVKGVNGHDVRLDLTTPKAGQDTYQEVLDKVQAEATILTV